MHLAEEQRVIEASQGLCRRDCKVPQDQRGPASWLQAVESAFEAQVVVNLHDALLLVTRSKDATRGSWHRY